MGNHVFYYNGEIFSEIKIKEKLFPKAMEAEKAAYCRVAFDYLDESFILTLNYFRAYQLFYNSDKNNEKESFLEPSDIHVIKMTKKKMRVFLKKINFKGFQFDSNRDNNEEMVEKIDLYLNEFVFINCESEIDNCADEALEVFKKMKDTYSNVLRQFEQNKEKYESEKRERVNTLELKYLLSENQHKCFLRLFNVGQANCSALYVESDKIPSVVFDLGADEYSKKNNTELMNMINNLDGNGFLVISHFDWDHYNMYKLLPKDAFNRLFVVHEFPKYLSGRRSAFAHTLFLNNTPVYVIKNNTILTTADYKNFALFDICQGLKLRKNKGQSTLENTYSLVSMININGVEAIIPGDALEDEFVINNGKVFQYAIVSHHGCKYNGIEIPYFAYNAFLPVNKIAEKRYGHPQLDHILKYNYVVRFGNDNSKVFSGRMLCKDNVTSKNCSEFIDWHF